MDRNLTVLFLRRLRESYNIGQKKMADLMCVSHRTYQRIESGESELSASQFLKTLKLFQKDYLLTYFKLLSSNVNPDQIPTPQDHSKFLNANGPIEFYSKSMVKEYIDQKLQTKPFYTEENLESENLTGYWEYNVLDNTFFFSPELYTLYGLEKKNPISNKDITKNIFSEDMDSLNLNFKEFFVHGIPVVNRHRVRLNEEQYYAVNAISELFEVDSKIYLAGVLNAYLIVK